MIQPRRKQYFSVVIVSICLSKHKGFGSYCSYISESTISSFKAKRRDFMSVWPNVMELSRNMGANRVDKKMKYNSYVLNYKAQGPLAVKMLLCSTTA